MESQPENLYSGIILKTFSQPLSYIYNTENGMREPAKFENSRLGFIDAVNDH